MRILPSLLALPTLAALAQSPSPERLFYYVDREDSYNAFVKHIDQISIVGPQTYYVDSLGVVWGSIDSRLLELAKARSVKVMPLLVNEGFNQPELRKLLADTAAQHRATRAMVELCRRYGFWGFQFDVENISIQDKDRFTAWYVDAARALHAAGFTISIAVVPRASEFAGTTGYHRWIFDSWRGAYDLSAIAKVSDLVSWMTYDQHTRRTPPGPVAGVPWMRASVEYALQSIPAEKLSLGIPTYSYHWSVQEQPGTALRAGVVGASVSYAWGAHLIERGGGKLSWDSTQKVLYGSAPNGDINEWVFLEDVRSFQAKLDLLRERKLRGFSAWVLGREDERIWDVLARLK